MLAYAPHIMQAHVAQLGAQLLSEQAQNAQLRSDNEVINMLMYSMCSQH